MICTRCQKDGVYQNQGTVYCQAHFLSYFEDKVDKTIKKFDLVSQDDKVCVAVSGGKDSLAVLSCIIRHCKKRNIEYFALAIDEGIKGYRDKTLMDLTKFCKENDVELKIVSFRERFGITLDQAKGKALEHDKKPCTVCGVLRRAAINKASRELGATKLVTGHNLDDEAQTFLMNLFQGNMSHNAKMGPKTGMVQNDKFIPRIKPLYFMTEKETRLYCLLKGYTVEFTECPNVDLSFRIFVRDKLNEITQKLPNAKYGVVNAFLEVLPDLKARYAPQVRLGECSVCAEPTTQDKCNACILEEKLCLELKNT